MRAAAGPDATTSRTSCAPTPGVELESVIELPARDHGVASVNSRLILR